MCVCIYASAYKCAASLSKCSHLCVPVHARAPFSMHVECARHARQSVSQWVINGCNMMTDDSERPVPPRPCPCGVVLVSMVRRTQRPTQADWLILSSTLLLSLHSVRPELLQSLTITISMTAKSQNISVIHETSRTHPSSIFLNSPHIPPKSNTRQADSHLQF